MARERAQQLLQRASRITVDTNNKLKELRGEREDESSSWTLALIYAHFSLNCRHARLSLEWREGAQLAGESGRST